MVQAASAKMAQRHDNAKRWRLAGTGMVAVRMVSSRQVGRRDLTAIRVDCGVAVAARPIPSSLDGEIPHLRCPERYLERYLERYFCPNFGWRATKCQP